MDGPGAVHSVAPAPRASVGVDGPAVIRSGSVRPGERLPLPLGADGLRLLRRIATARIGDDIQTGAYVAMRQQNRRRTYSRSR